MIFQLLSPTTALRAEAWFFQVVGSSKNDAAVESFGPHGPPYSPPEAKPNAGPPLASAQLSHFHPGIMLTPFLDD